MHMKKAIDIIYLDFCKAFDKVPHKRLIYKLRCNGLNDKLKEWIQAFLTGRRQRVVLGKAFSSWKEVISGVPQGSLLGPILFVIFINDLPDKIKNVIKLFADDTKVISLIDNENDSSILQEDLNNLHEWSKQWLVDFKEEKCVSMHFGSNNKNYEYSLNSHKLTESRQERDLGVIFSKDLKNSGHIAVATRKANYAV
ncbi:unnamed protein product [Brachionus calyciflorus]|uniref:Reverse transcriptase domain-containing protein n=1 Tax=Brachionus calyciflorus TaxID=104777 RepID=A0A814J8W3_9BILA|nr:unnamed protein product [Brachionus calyciflorus]